MTYYTRQQAYEASLKWFGGDELAANVFVDKYALRNENDEFIELIPEDAMHRVAKELARIEAKYPEPMSEDEIYSYLIEYDPVVKRNTMGKASPQGSPLAGIGNNKQVMSLANCFVIEAPHDSYSGILYSDEELVSIMKMRGGVGLDLSTLRPRGMSVANAARTTDGVQLFAERYSNSCREVAQNSRRGALMETLSVKHPDILAFINMKRDLSKVTGANVSVRVTDDFMNAVINDADFTLQFPVDVPVEEAKFTKVVKAKDIWNQLMDAAWFAAEPGILFWDNIIKNTPSDAYKYHGFMTQSVNPCGEICLPANEVCRLFILNLTKFVDNQFTKKATFNFEKFKTTTFKVMRMMDDLVSLDIEATETIINKINNDPEPDFIKNRQLKLWQKVKERSEKGRRCGLGQTGLGDTLAMLNIRYGSEESIKMTEEIYKALELSAYASTIDLAKTRGAFPVFDFTLEKKHDFLLKIMKEAPQLVEDWKKYGRRNIAISTTAPVGSISILTQTTSGIEPVFKASYTRRKKIVNENEKVNFIDAQGDKWQQFTVNHHGLQRWIDITNKTDYKESPYYGAESSDIDWVASVKLQAAAQKWICHAISKTCNLPKDATHDIVNQVYIEAWKSGCKGFTIYRDGSRDGVLLSDDGSKKYDVNTRCDGIPELELKTMIEVSETYKSFMPPGYLAYIEEVKQYLNKDNISIRPKTIQETNAPERPKEVVCDIHRANVKGEQYTIIVGLLDGKPYEIFAGLSRMVEVPKKIKSGFLLKNGKGIDGISTYNLRLPINGDDEVIFKDVVTLFDNPSYGALTRILSMSLRHGTSIIHICDQLKKDKHSDLTSFATVIARVLSKNYIVDGTKAAIGSSCPSCKVTGTLGYSQGCISCSNCAWSKCD